MAVKFEIPLVAQARGMSCWYASACMVAYYRKQGPRLGIPDKWHSDQGLGLNEIMRLARAEGLTPINAPAQNLTEQQLEVFLQNYGPLWCAGTWYGFGHVVVLTGVDNGMVYINDPDQGVKKTESIAWFNEKLLNQTHGCLMYSSI